MNEKLIAQYNSLYERADNIFGEGKPLKQVVALPDHLSGGKILDVGGGEGRNALYLAQRGFDVTVMDVSTVGLKKLETVAEEKDIQIKTELRDVVNDGIVQEYDGVIFSFVLHHLQTNEAEAVLNEAKDKTVAGGVHVIATFLNEGELYERNEQTNRFYPSEETMRDMYQNWEVLELTTREAESLARNKEGDRMLNMVVHLMVKKPDTANEPAQD